MHCSLFCACSFRHHIKNDSDSSNEFSSPICRSTSVYWLNVVLSSERILTPMVVLRCLSASKYCTIANAIMIMYYFWSSNRKLQVSMSFTAFSRFGLYKAAEVITTQRQNVKSGWGEDKELFYFSHRRVHSKLLGLFSRGADVIGKIKSYLPELKTWFIFFSWLHFTIFTFFILDEWLICLSPLYGGCLCSFQPVEEVLTFAYCFVDITTGADFTCSLICRQNMYLLI